MSDIVKRLQGSLALDAINGDTAERAVCASQMREAAAEITRLRERCEALEAAIECSGMDISPCLACGEPVVCVLDGMPMCDKCGAKEPDHAD